MHQTILPAKSKVIADSGRAPRPVRGVDDWPLADLILLDEARPGFLARIFQSGDLRRQAVFAALTRGVMGRPDAIMEVMARQPALGDQSPLGHVAAYLSHARAREIIVATFGTCPRHLLALLRRLGANALLPEAYGDLHRLATSPSSPASLRYLLGRAEIIPIDIKKAERLRSEVLLSKLAAKIHNIEEIDRVNTIIGIALRASSTITPEWLAQSLCDVGGSTTVDGWLFGLMERFDTCLVEPPFLGDDEARLLCTAGALIGAARQYNNCLKNMLGDALSGRSCFYEFPRDKVIAHVKILANRTGYLDDMYGVHNRRVSKSVRAGIVEKFAHLGLPSLYINDDCPELATISSLRTPWQFRDLPVEDEVDA